MKILQINSVCGIRSTGRIVVDIAEEYMSAGHECRIAYGRELAPEKYNKIAYKIGTELNVKINALKTRILDNEGFNAKKETIKFIEWANNYDPDVLWLHNIHGYYINIDLLFEWIKQRPHMEVKWVLHDCWPITGHCAHFAYVRCTQWKNNCFKCRQKKEYPKSVFLDNCEKNFKKKKELFTDIEKMTLIAPSHWLANIVKNSFLKDYPIEVKHNKIDEKIFKPTKGTFRERYGLEKSFIVLGVASAWSDKKGLDDFKLISFLLEEPFKIVLVGLDKKQLKQLPPEILGIERTNCPEELAEIYTAADVFLNLTYEDTYPTVNLEAQACGTPCITYRTGGSVESVPPENVIEQGNIDELLNKLADLKENSK